MGIIIAIFVIISAIIHAVKPHNTAAVFVSQYLSAISFAGQTVFFSWANVICSNDLQERAIVLASMNMFSNAVNAWWSLLFYAADTVPEFKKGCWASLATGIASIVVVIIIRVLQAREAGIVAEVVTEDTESDRPIKV
ncbi:Pantothenate transporter FEN2 [Candida tropicalis]